MSGASPARATGAKAARPAAKRPADAAPPRLRTTAAVRATPRAATPEAPPAVTKAATTANTKAASAAGPAAKPAKRPRKSAKADPGRLERLVAAAVKSLEDDKAEDVTVLDVTGRASFTDRMVIATGLADRQIQAMAAHLDEALGKEGLKLRKDAVQASDDWVLIDAGDLVIHLFKPEARLIYDLEKMWGPDSPLGEAGPGEQSPI